ncbi:SDR family NAD(P)-dependent oxidoreductase [Ammoniphilus resinae]|uniref:NAD(P)-dependent dehydrogenase (Short-subunit alcohol dehydrogenase family) n=1 Tax=Ammoniphilus resinae TaxID=861532 RepID=A0ABS4GVM1_9BACL|nr:SDR family oxidoreductase [Ammoniphilus resinae]MBP1934307.1 NAD(P)-dependent dehydrogenase (short-subunit alcohol dehydrogenase family) [Ammoniphilus resinae]
MRLEDKIAIVTGGATGIGYAIVEEFLKQGAKVVIAGIVEEENKAAVENLSSLGEVTAIHTDVSNSASVQSMVQKTIEQYGRIDILVNNAAIQIYGMTEETTEENFERVISVNLKGPFLCMKYVLPHMRKQQKGSIVNMGSVNALAGHPTLFAYGTAKGGLHAMTRVTAIEYAKEGIRCNVIAPGTVNTPILRRHLENQSPDPTKAMQAFNDIHPVGRIAEPREIALAAVYLASDESSFTTGETLVVDGGYRVQGFLP